MKNQTILTYLAAAFLFIGSYSLQSAEPNWWTEYSLIDGSTRQDDAVVTIGQAKHAVQKAYQYLEVELADVGGAGSEVTNLYTTYCDPTKSVNDFKPLTIGQLKFLTKRFYDRLNETAIDFRTNRMTPPYGDRDIYPWIIYQVTESDLKLATIGQLKFVFSFDLSRWHSPTSDADMDSMLDRWEQLVADANIADSILVPEDLLPEVDEDGDGISNLNEFNADTDPLNRDHPSLRLVLY